MLLRQKGNIFILLLTVALIFLISFFLITFMGKKAPVTNEPIAKIVIKNIANEQSTNSNVGNKSEKALEIFEKIKKVSTKETEIKIQQSTGINSTKASNSSSSASKQTYSNIEITLRDLETLHKILVLLASEKIFQVYDTSLSVNTVGKAKSPIPNIAKITATVEAVEPTYELSKETAEKKMLALKESLRNIGAEIKTSWISSEKPTTIPRKTTNNNRFSISFEINLENFEIVDSVLQLLKQDGINQIEGPTLVSDDNSLNKTKSSARINSIENARFKAEELTKSTNIQIGKVVEIREQSEFIYPKQIYAVGGADLREKASSIQPGQDEVSINVQVDFELK